MIIYQYVNTCMLFPDPSTRALEPTLGSPPSNRLDALGGPSQGLRRHRRLQPGALAEPRADGRRGGAAAASRGSLGTDPGDL